jgi:hypothetical protein
LGIVTMQKARLRHAYRLIRENRVDDARQFLKAMDNPTATAWLARLDQNRPFPAPAEHLIGTDDDDAFLDAWAHAERWIAALSGLVVISLGLIVLGNPGVLNIQDEQLESDASRLIIQLCPLWIAGIGLFLLWQATRPDDIRHGLLTLASPLEWLQLAGYAMLGGLLLTMSHSPSGYVLSAVIMMRGLYHGWRLWQIKRFTNRSE